MNSYEDFVHFIRGQKPKEKMLIGEMTSESTCRIGENEYQQDDFWVSENLKYPICTKAKGEESDYLQPLKKGDRVLTYQINDEKFVILERLVNL